MKSYIKWLCSQLHNPNPVIELDLDMNIIYHNEACKNHPSISQLLTETHEELNKFQYLLKRNHQI